MTTLHNRVNELGVAEPVIQQQGGDRIVVQLPGVQDTAKAKDILGRTATLEARLPHHTEHFEPSFSTFAKNFSLSSFICSDSFILSLVLDIVNISAILFI